MIPRGVLVSVRDASEAEAALAGGARVIDVKDPAAGSLGAATAAAIAAVARQVAGRAPWTFALGELAAGLGPIGALLADVAAALAEDAAGPAAVKAGLAGMAGRDWRGHLERLARILPAGCRQAAVAYADFDRVAAPPPPDVIAAAGRVDCGWLLIDTCDKRGPSLRTARPAAEVAAWIEQARAAGLGVAVAGRLGIADIPPTLELGPDVVALRTAVCSNHGEGDPRLGRVDPGLVAAAVAAAAALAPPESPLPAGTIR